MAKVESSIWGKAPDGQDIILYRMTNANSAYVELSSIGAGIVSVVVPDRDGKIADVTLGYPDPLSYFGDGPCAGKTPGRFAGRIGGACFTLDGKEYELPVNNGPNSLHGGPEGFANKVWQSRESEGGVEFMLISPDGDSGYPGKLKVVVRYEWTDTNELLITYQAQTDAPTVINLTNHAYWNLKGEGEGDIHDHVLTLNCSEWLPTDEVMIPTGEAAPVAGTPMDFLNPKEIGRDIAKKFEALMIGRGYDNVWLVDGAQEGQLSQAAELYSPQSGRVLKIFSTQPAVVVYTGNFLSGCPEGKNGHVYENRSGVALECQHFPDSPNKIGFPTTVLRPGEEYQHAIIYAFSNR